MSQQRPRLAHNRVIIAEYKVHWAAWADEDDEWTPGTGNIPQEFIDEYHSVTDPFRAISMDTNLANPLEMVCEEDLKFERKARKGKARKSTGRRGRRSRSLCINNDVCSSKFCNICRSS